MPHPVLVAAEQFKAQALARERAAATQLVRAYGQVYHNLDPQIRALAEVVRAAGQLTRGQVSRLNALRVLRADTIEQINRYAAYADVTVVEQVRLNIAAGLADSEALVQAHFDPDWMAQNGLRLNANVGDALRARWTRVPVESVEQMIGMTQPTSPLRAALVNRLGETVATQMVDALVEGIALGQNPRVIARRCMGNGLNYSLNTARTAQLWAYRSASSANYRANRDIVAGWRWHATLSSRTCVSCLAMHGRRFSVDEDLNDHHAGRCTAMPIVPLAARLGLPEPDFEDAEAWLRAQPEKSQREQMGAGIWEEWHAGRVRFADLTTTYEDAVYGTMRRAPTLEAVLAGVR
jgi:hypothetical protein